MKRDYVTVLLIAFAVTSLLIVSTPSFGQEQAEPQTAPAFSVSRIAIAEGVENLEPVSVSETFPSTTERVYCFIEATNIEVDTEVTFIWYHEGTEMRTFSIPIMQGSRWRTFAYKNLYGRTGNWKVEIKDAAGNLVKSLSFTVE
jgi:hypothetical protein